MKRKRTKPLIRLLSSQWAKLGLATVFSVFISVCAKAQTAGDDTKPVRDLNSELRNRTWSIYAQGGVSWATGVWYPNENAKRSYNQSPAVGGGVDFTIRPWVRIGAEYLYSRYRREQRYSEIDANAVPAKTYGNYMMNTHNVKVGAGFNFMEFWPARRAQWLNIWLGTGVGHTFARGNEYGIYFSNTVTQGGVTKPLTGGTSISNDMEVTITGNVKTTNRHESFNKFYIPASLNVEADLCRNVTLGLKGEMDWLLNREDIAPKNLIYGLVTLRYNFVPSRAKALTKYYDGQVSMLNDRVNTLMADVESANSRLQDAEAAKARLESENADLQRRLNDCEEEKARAAVQELPSHYVQFGHDKSAVTKEEAEKLRAFAQTVQGRPLKLVAEASTPGTKQYNQKLSERRLSRVMKILKKEGFLHKNLYWSIAIGADNGKPSAEGRRVTITVQE